MDSVLILIIFFLLFIPLSSLHFYIQIIQQTHSAPPPSFSPCVRVLMPPTPPLLHDAQLPPGSVSFAGRGNTHATQKGQPGLDHSEPTPHCELPVGLPGSFVTAGGFRTRGGVPPCLTPARALLTTPTPHQHTNTPEGASAQLLMRVFFLFSFGVLQSSPDYFSCFVAVAADACALVYVSEI